MSSLKGSQVSEMLSASAAIASGKTTFYIIILMILKLIFIFLQCYRLNRKHVNFNTLLPCICIATVSARICSDKTVLFIYCG